MEPEADQHAAQAGSTVSRESLIELLDASSDGVMKIDRAWQVEYANRRAQELLGSGTDLVGQNHWQAFPITLYEGSPFVEHYRRSMEGKTASGFQAFIGGRFDCWIDVSVSPAADGIIVYLRDVTEGKLQQQENQQVADRLHMALCVTNSVGIWDWDIERDLVYADRVFAEAYGVDPARAAAGCPITEFTGGIAVQDRERVHHEISVAMQTGGEYSSEYRLAPRAGEMRWISARGRCQFSEDGRPLRFPGVTVDITDRKLAEEALLQTEKLAAVGRMASVISHEINNPLEAVTNLLYIVRASPSLAREDREHLELADRELARVSQITAQALRFHRNGSNVVELSADIIVQELLSLYRTRLTASNIRVRLDLQEEVTFQAYEGEVRQVLNNLFGNAFDAMRKGGTLRIRSRCASDPKTGEKGASITVADTGQGIPLEVRARIFEAFYSTKGINGTGLGLWISRRIVQKHKGQLTFRTFVGPRHGSVFRLWVPLKAAANPEEEWTRLTQADGLSVDR